MYAINVVQTTIELGVTNATLEEIDDVVAAVKNGDGAFVNQTYALAEDENGVAITFTGPGYVSSLLLVGIKRTDRLCRGHASEGTESPLSLSVQTYRALEASNSTTHTTSHPTLPTPSSESPSPSVPDTPSSSRKSDRTSTTPSRAYPTRSHMISHIRRWKSTKNWANTL